MTELTQQGFGCPMIGAFANGRVEKFLHGYAPLEPTDFHDPTTSAAIAAQMGHMHALSLSGTRSPAVFRTLAKWLELVKQVAFSDETDAALLQQLDVVSALRMRVSLGTSCYARCSLLCSRHWHAKSSG